MSNIITEQTNNENRNRNLTFQEYQSIYNELTNRTEQIKKKYQKSFNLIKTHISHLNEIIKTINTQYKVVSCNSNVVAFQSDKTEKVYSSIENFLAIDTLIKATESLRVEYNILIDTPNINKKQNYKISILLVSDLTTFEKLRDEIPIELIDLIEKDNIVVELNYIDYTIAKNYLNSLNEWVDDITDKSNSFDELISKHKSKIAYTLKYIIISASIYLIFSYIPKYISSTEINMQLLIKYILVSGLVFYLSEKISSFASFTVRKTLMYLNNYSSIEITSEDSKNVSTYKNSRKKRITIFITTVILTIVYGVISSIIASSIIESNDKELVIKAK